MCNTNQANWPEKRSAEPAKVFLGDHVEDMLQFFLRLLWCVANRVATGDGRNIGHVAAVVVSPANHLIIKQRLHL